MWAPAKIANPDYFEDKEPLKNLADIAAVAVEIWTMDEGYYFDNVLVSNDVLKAQEYREKYWAPKHEHELVSRRVAFLGSPMLAVCMCIVLQTVLSQHLISWLRAVQQMLACAEWCPLYRLQTHTAAYATPAVNL